MFNRFTVSFRFVADCGGRSWLPVSAMSQSFYGSLLAVVQDAQGGVMPGRHRRARPTPPRTSGVKA